MHAETLRGPGREKLPFAEYSVSFFEKDCLGRPTFAPSALRWASRDKACPPKLTQPAKEGPQAAKFAGGHRIRVTPVPIPNTEVKPDTADGTAWETVWESRSLPAVIRKRGPMSHESHRASCLYGFVDTYCGRTSAHSERGGLLRAQLRSKR